MILSKSDLSLLVPFCLQLLFEFVVLVGLLFHLSSGFSFICFILFCVLWVDAVAMVMTFVDIIMCLPLIVVTQCVSGFEVFDWSACALSGLQPMSMKYFMLAKHGIS